MPRASTPIFNITYFQLQLHCDFPFALHFDHNNENTKIILPAYGIGEREKRKNTTTAPTKHAEQWNSFYEQHTPVIGHIVLYSINKWVSEIACSVVNFRCCCYCCCCCCCCYCRTASSFPLSWPSVAPTKEMPITNFNTFNDSVCMK